MFTKISEQMNKLAEEAVLRHQIDEANLPIPDEYKDITAKINYYIRKLMPQLVNPQEMDSMEAISDALREVSTEAFEYTANEYREKGDWENYGLTRWLQANSGVPMRKP